MKTWFLLLAAVMFAAAVPAAADVTIEMKLNDSPQTVLASAHNIRFDGLDMVTIFRGDKKVLWAADMTRKTYTEMTKADMAAMGSQISEAMAQIQATLKDLPPEQRAAVEAMMPKGAAAAAPPKAVIAATGKSKTINGWPCKEYTSTSERVVTEVWSTDPKKMDLAASDFGAFKEFAAFVKKMLPGMSGMESFMKDFDKPGEGQVPGIPVLSIMRNEKGEETMRTELTKVTKGSIAASRFELPGGLTKESLPRGGAVPQGD